MSVCNEMDSLVCKFWWGPRFDSGIYLVLKNWKLICQPRHLGGLDFCKFEEINLSLLAKLGWLIAFEKDSLWVLSQGKIYSKL